MIEMKKYLAFLLATLLVVSMVAAFAMPHPIYGKITHGGQAVKNLEIEVKNLDTGVSNTALTDLEGYFQVDLGNVDTAYRTGDQIQVSLVYCKSLAVCKKSVLVSGGGNEVFFDIASESDLPDEVVIVKHICWNGQGVESVSDCPVKPEPKPIVVKEVQCSDGTLVESEADCPVEPEEKDPLTLILGILSGLLAVAVVILSKFAWGKGFVGLVKYYKRKGDEAWKNGDKEAAAKHYRRAAKMVGTALAKAKEGEYQ